MKESIYDLSVKIENNTATKEEMIIFIERCIYHNINTIQSLSLCTVKDIKSIANHLVWLNKTQ